MFKGNKYFKRAVLAFVITLCTVCLAGFSSCSFIVNAILDGTLAEDKTASGPLKVQKGEFSDGSSLDVYSFDVESSYTNYYIWINYKYSDATAKCEASSIRSGFTVTTASEGYCNVYASGASDKYNGYVRSKISGGKIYIYVRPVDALSSNAGTYSLSVGTDTSYSKSTLVKLTKEDSSKTPKYDYTNYTLSYLLDTDSDAYKRFGFTGTKNTTYSLMIMDAGNASADFKLDVVAEVYTGSSISSPLLSLSDEGGNFTLGNSNQTVYIKITPYKSGKTGNFALKVTDADGKKISLTEYSY